MLPNFKLQISQNNMFPYVWVCQNSDKIKATDPCNIKDVCFVSLFIYVQIEINDSKHHCATTLDFTFTCESLESLFMVNTKKVK